MQVTSPGIFSIVSHYPLEIAKTTHNRFALIISDSYLYQGFFSLKNRLLPTVRVKEFQDFIRLNQLPDSKLLIDTIVSNDFPKMRTEIYTLLNRFPDDELNDIIKGVFAAQSEETDQRLIKRLMSLLTLAKVEGAVKSKLVDFDLQKSVDIIAGRAQRELSTEKLENASLIRLTKYYLSTSVGWFVDKLMYVCMLKDITDGDANSTERQMVATLQWQVFRDHIAFIGACLVGLTLYTGTAAVTAAVAAAIVIPLITISIIYLKYFKPAPLDLHPATNSDRLAAENKLPKVLFRDDIEEQILTFLNMNLSNNNSWLYPLLIGESGIGKTGIFNNIARKAFLGLIDGPLKDITYYSTSAADLIDGQGTAEHLEILLKLLFGEERKGCILVDEAQAMFDTPERQVLLNLFLRAMNPGEGLPLLVFACTRADYEKYVSRHDSFMRRVKVIDINSLTPQQVYTVLALETAKNFPNIIINSDVFTELSQITKDPVFANSPQPCTSKAILYRALGDLQTNPYGEDQALLTKKLNEIIIRDTKQKTKENDLKAFDSFYPDSDHAFSDEITDSQSSSQDLDDEIDEHRVNEKGSLEDQIDRLSKKIEKSRARLKAFENLLQDKRTLNQGIESLALRLTHHQASEQEYKKFILMREYLRPALDQKILHKKEKLGASCPEITLEKIRFYIAEEKKAREERNRRKQVEESE